MKPKPHSGTTGIRIQYSRALGQSPDQESALGPTAKIQDFKLPWIKSPEARAVTPTATVEAIEHPVEPPVVPFEVICEQIRRHHEAKTEILREALQRSESSQTRFWGINE